MKAEYQLLLEQTRALLSVSKDPIANAANLSAIVWQSLSDLNWVGFYFLKSERLVLGPFQGKPACVEIPLGKGVCGAAAESKTSQRIADVDAFEGHIVCDKASASELVVPIIYLDGSLCGVLDVDAPLKNRFTLDEQELFESLARVYVDAIQLID